MRSTRHVKHIRPTNMKYLLSYAVLIVIPLFPGALATSVGPTLRDQQDPIMNIPLPGFGSGKDSSNDASDVIISDVIGKDRAINIFAGFTRDIDSISKRLMMIRKIPLY